MYIYQTDTSRACPERMIGMLLHCPRAYCEPYVCSPRQLAWGICRRIIILTHGYNSNRPRFTPNEDCPIASRKFVTYYETVRYWRDLATWHCQYTPKRRPWRKCIHGARRECRWESCDRRAAEDLTYRGRAFPDSGARPPG